MDANQIKAQYSGYAGWNDPNAILADFKATGGAGKGGPSNSGISQAGDSSSTDYNQIYRQQQQFQQEAVKPVVQSLEAQKAPLQARYDNLIKQLQGKETQEVGAQQTALSQEYGKRGIPLQSGAFQQDLLGKTQQITQNYAGLQGEAVASEQADLANLATTIAQAQASGNTNALQNALSLYQQNQSNQNTQNAQSLAQKIYQETTLPASQASVLNTQANTRKTLKDLQSSLGGNTNYYDTPSTSNGSSNTGKSVLSSQSPQVSAPAGKYYQQPDGSVWLSNGASGWKQVS